MKYFRGLAGSKLLPVVILSFVSCVLLLWRTVFVSDRFLFMIWNLFLAWLPLLWAYLLINNLRRERWLSWKNLAYSFLWLALLPNSFYIVTDFIHLRNSSASNVLFDAVMFMSFSMTGILLGCIAIYLLHKQLAKRIGADYTWRFLTLVFLLNGVAIYLGRHQRWNSWDLLANPLFILLDLVNNLTSVDSLPSTLGVIALFFFFVTSCYMVFWTGIMSIKRLK